MKTKSNIQTGSKNSYNTRCIPPWIEDPFTLFVGLGFKIKSWHCFPSNNIVFVTMKHNSEVVQSNNK